MLPSDYLDVAHVDNLDKILLLRHSVQWKTTGINCFFIGYVYHVESHLWPKKNTQEDEKMMEIYQINNMFFCLPLMTTDNYISIIRSALHSATLTCLFQQCTCLTSVFLFWVQLVLHVLHGVDFYVKIGQSHAEKSRISECCIKHGFTLSSASMNDAYK